MRLPSSAGGGGLRLNLTPLIDVIFNLIIFFLAAAHFARNEPTEAVDLPLAAPRDAAAEPPKRVTVTVLPGDAAGPRFLLSGREEPRAVVEAAIAAGKAEAGDEPFEVRFRADRSVPFGEVEPLLVAAAKAGVADVKFAIAPRGD